MRSRMACSDLRERFSLYLDGAVSGHEMQEISSHLHTCIACAAEFSSLRTVQQSLASLGTVRPPADLGMRLRLAISHERLRTSTSIVDRFRESFSLLWQNALRPLVLPASAGLAGALVLIGSVALLLGFVAVPEPVMANDEPLGALTSPHYAYSVERQRPIITGHDATIVVDALINSHGEVYDYTIVSGPEDEATRRQITGQLLESVFEPASAFGAPTRGRVVLTFSGVSVHA